MIHTVTAPNPGPMTLTGTNTYVVTSPERALVVDPGPHDRGHLDAILAAADGLPITAVVVTHGHADHTDAVAPLLARTGAAHLDLHRCTDRATLAHFGVEAIDTPGHTADSVCFVVADPAGPVLLSGDTVLGTGPSVVDDLVAYLDSLALLVQLIRDRGIVRLLPGHGPAAADPLAHVTALQRHRLDRLAQVAEAVAAGARTPADVVARVYPGLAVELLPAALASADAQLRYLGTGSEPPS